MNPFNAIVIGLLGLVALGMSLRSLATGVIDVGGKRGGTYLVTSADSPGVFVGSVLLMLALGVLGLLVAWQVLTGKRDE